MKHSGIEMYREVVPKTISILNSLSRISLDLTMVLLLTQHLSLLNEV